MTKALFRRLTRRFTVGDGCWQWDKADGPAGYGRITLMGRRIGAHRAVYELLMGPIPDGMVLDHLCKNTLCVNPAHLEIVTERENLLRGDGAFAINARRTHCVNNHEFTSENTYIRTNGNRTCKECVRAAHRRYMRAKRQKVSN